MQRVEITGSSIKRTHQEGIAPVQIITRKEIEQSGKLTISEVLRSLSADNNGSISPSFTNGFARSASGVSLRGLTVNATLVLINGRRVAPYGFGDDGVRNFVDLNSIPLEAVDRIDVLKDGASAIYGSDAIGGVINIVLRQSYQGKTIYASAGQSERGDGTITRTSGTFGFGDLDADKFNFFVNIEARKQSAINSKDRDDYLGQADARRWGGRDQRLGTTSSSNTGGTSLVGTVRPVNAAGVVIAGRGIQNLPGCPVGGVDTGTPINSGGGCLYDPLQLGYQEIQPETENINLFGRGTFKLGESKQAYFEAGLFHSRARTINTPSGLTGAGFDIVNQRINDTSTGANQLLLPIGHPENPFTDARARPRFAAGSAPRRVSLETTVTRLLAGLKGTMGAWDYDAALMYAESRSEKIQNGYVSKTAVAAAVASNSFRIGQNFGLNAPEVLAAVYPTLVSSAVSKVSLVDFKATRDLMPMQGGAMAIALGGELRHESINTQATPFTDTNDIVGLGYAAAKASRNIAALYAELAIPVLKPLELQVAVRSDQYSDAGNSTTPKLGFKYTPAHQLAFRGSYAEGFRAPSAAENGDSAVSGFTTITRDPVRCAVTKLPLDCSLTRSVGAITIGNRNVRPETSQSFNLGVVLEPVRHSSISIDFWRIIRKNEIVLSDPASVINNPAAFPASEIVRGEPTVDFPNLVGPIRLVKAPYLNAGKTLTSGVDIDLRTRIDLGTNGRLLAGLTVTQLFEFTRISNTGLQQSFVGTHGDINLSGNGGTPRTKASFTLGWENGPWLISSIVHYVGSLDNVNERGGPCLDIDPVTGVPLLNCRVASFATVNLFAKWKLSKQWEISGSVSNLFDRMAPLDVQTYGRINYNPSLHQAGAVGRYFNISTRYTF